MQDIPGAEQGATGTLSQVSGRYGSGVSRYTDGRGRVSVPIQVAQVELFLLKHEKPQPAQQFDSTKRLPGISVLVRHFGGRRGPQRRQSV